MKTKSSREIRSDFFDFFKSKKHTIVPSAPLLPIGDKTLLFTNAGMNQFKDVFLGTGNRDYSRAADTQKCMRVSGKHNDLDDVGRDTYHHTFFEMLGNWSFGDYYKKEAISWAWELLTERWGLSKDKLYATVYKDDQEAWELWASETDIDREHILYFGDKDNFWEMGETGPCGPCSEIHIDLGEDACDKKDIDHECGVNGICGRYIELWNLVFIQYDRQKDRSLNPLPSTHVDTGMGFERIVSVLQGKLSNYDTDIFTPLISKIEKLSGKKNDSVNGICMRVIADHVRSLSFSIADGIMPSNEGRGYVLRKILRRALRFAQQLELSKPFLGELLPVLIETMGEVFPELKKNRVRILEILENEESRFFSTLHSGMQELGNIINRIREQGGKTIPAEDLFKLYDSMGFPLDIAREVATDEEMVLDEDGFNNLMQEQKDRGRQSWKGAQDRAFGFLPADIAPTEYTGESESSTEAGILLLFTEEGLQESAPSGSEAWLVCDKTPFYAEGGGQAADTGELVWDSGKAVVLDVFRRDKAFVHHFRVEEGTLHRTANVTLSVASERKKDIARNHTATHLLQQALVEMLGEHVAQAGSLVEPERLRFDFSHFKSISRDMLDRVEQRVNAEIRKSTPVSCEVMDKDAAVAKGAKAIFGEKYGDSVRVVTVEDFSMELCGGTHVTNTGEIALFKIITESSVASGVRRIEAVTGKAALKAVQEWHSSLLNLAGSLNCPVEDVGDRVAALRDKVHQLEKQAARDKAGSALETINKLAEKSTQINGVSVISGRVDNVDAKTLKKAVDDFKNRLKDAVVLLGGDNGGKCLLVMGASGKALECGFDSKVALNAVARAVNGGGGGRADMAQAGGKDTAKLDDAFLQAKDVIKKGLGG